MATVTVKIMRGRDTLLEGTLTGNITYRQLFDLEVSINRDTELRAHLFFVPEDKTSDRLPRKEIDGPK